MTLKRYTFSMDGKTPLMILQEFCQKKGFVPDFETVKVEGPCHNGCFTMKVKVGGIEATGEGTTKKKAKQLAATDALKQLMGEDAIKPYEPAAKEEDHIPTNIVGYLHEFCLKHHLPLSTFTIVREMGHPHNKTFEGELVLGPFKTTASAKCKKEAKKKAAFEMLEHLKSLDQDQLKPLLLNDDVDTKDIREKVNDLTELCRMKGLPEPQFSYERTITVQCKVGNITLQANAVGLEAAKISAANKMMEALEKQDFSLYKSLKI